ncbi:MAG: DUF3362 domain-containing protein, partial [Betaproteobacteria bacterium]
RTSESVPVPKSGRARRLHKAFLRYHDPENWPLLREALKQMGRADLIGGSKKHLVPAWQPAGTERAHAAPALHPPQDRRDSKSQARPEKPDSSGKPPQRARPAAAKSRTPRRAR